MGEVAALGTRRKLGIEDVEGLVYVDRLSLSFPVRDYYEKSFPSSARVRNSLTGEVLRDSLSVSVRTCGCGERRCKHGSRGRAFVGVQFLAGVGFFGKVEVNPSPWFDPDGYEPMPLSKLEEAVQLAQVVVEEQGVSAAAPVERWKVKRVDFARPFSGVRSPGSFVRALAPLKRPYTTFNRVYSDPALARAQTLHAGSGAGAMRLYDRFEAYGDRVARGSMQWEVQAGPDWLGRFGMCHVEDLTPLRCQAFVADRWEWSRVGTEVSSSANVLDVVGRLVEAGGYRDERGEWVKMSPAKAKRLLGEMLTEQHGVSWGGSRQTAYDYDRLKRAIGLVLSPETFSATVDVRTRLDFETGTEVAA